MELKKLLLTGLASTFLLAACGTDDAETPAEDVEETDTAETAEEDISEDEEVVEEEVVEEDEEETTEEEEALYNEDHVVNYEIINEEDVSFANTTRYSYWIYPENGEMTEEELEATSMQFIEKLKDDFDFSAIALFYIDNPDNPVGYQAGMVEYVPNGEWSDADNSDDGDYSVHEYVFTYVESEEE
ncbi:hypothetical protein [Alkalibacterium sp. 20]|uniref:DUF4875 domain-containing protein n=1 Tax=Alkalibacterium sp. 20 TaxID=1798803 RepID=UPI0008FFF073|nr:hypothetical protein [Alkalibacterium sp. 20]OJF95231.1 hypothetical protein AX762_07090 [Alkalibacterium sp. 20]